MDNGDSLDLAALRERLKDESGRAYWQSLQELADTEAFQEAMRYEFPDGADEWTDSTGRRRFLRIMGASMALAGIGLSGCTGQPDASIVPYVDPQEEVVPGKPLFFATSFLLAGYAQGVLVESHMGRPTKVEGNPDHPASRGSTNTFMQASVLDLYDPDRSENVLFRGGTSTWSAFVQAMQQERRQWEANNGRGLRVLTGTVTSPTLGAQLRTLLQAFPDAQWHQYEPTARDSERVGLFRALGRYGKPVFHFDRAEVVLSLDDDFLLTRPGSVRYARDFAEIRRVRAGASTMNRLYVAESSSTITGAMADHRMPVPPSTLDTVARAVAQRLGLEGEPPPELQDERVEQWIDALVRDLRTHEGAALVVAGPTLSPEVHALVYRMNEVLGAIGNTVEYIEPVEARPEPHAPSLLRLAEDMADGAVETLVILGGNPAYTAPADVPFANLLLDVPTTVHLHPFTNLTSHRCVWHVPEKHYLEMWGDARAHDGTASIIQPLIDPLYDPCRSPHEVVSVLNGRLGATSLNLVRTYWQARYTGDRFEDVWEQALKDGVVPGTGLAPRETPFTTEVGAIRFEEVGETRLPEAVEEDLFAPEPPADLEPPAAAPPAEEEAPDDLLKGQTVDVVFRPDPTIWDGHFANNGWLQELPKPITKLVWDNAALVSLATAERLELHNETVIELAYRDHAVDAPVWIVPGHPDDTVTVYLGHGRPEGGRVASGTPRADEDPYGAGVTDEDPYANPYRPLGGGVGFSAYAIRPARSPWALTDVTLRKTGRTYNLVSAQHHYSMEGRELVREAPIEHFRENPDFIYDDGLPRELPGLYPEWEYTGYQWGMAIDTNVCIGCGACVVACQAENNIPVVGKEAVENGREMHWLVVDRYYKGDVDDPNTYFQPRPCMHCEKAPCEVVCPVYATVHDHQGLNLMVYNRCIGTRYCSNNCPYKVRRFNFLEWNDWEKDISKMQHNPDVSVRSRGVMEKCTYCQQRITAARIRANRQRREIYDGEVMTACQQACPTNAIVFGDINDETEVRRWKEEPHNYGLLAELNTQPRTTYLAHFDNPNPLVPQLAPGGRDIGEEEDIEVEVGIEEVGILTDE